MEKQLRSRNRVGVEQRPLASLCGECVARVEARRFREGGAGKEDEEERSACAREERRVYVQAAGRKTFGLSNGRARMRFE